MLTTSQAGALRTVIGLVFGTVMALAFGYAIISQTRDLVSMRSWRETPARILDLKLAETIGRGHSHYVTARYEYTVPGEASPRVGDNVAVEQDGVVWDYARDLFKRLDAQRQANGTVTCYYDPKDPSRVILSREIPISLVVVETLILLLCSGWAYLAVRAYEFYHPNEKRPREHYPRNR